MDGRSIPASASSSAWKRRGTATTGRRRCSGKNRGRGIAAGFWFNIGGASSCSASVNDDGIVTLVEGSTDIGGTRTSIAMQLAETLGIGAEDVRPQVGDTDSVGYTFLTGGSRVTFATGLAAYKLGLDLQDQMKHRAAAIWECDPAAITVEDGVYRHNGQSLTFKELAAKISEHRLDPVVGRASVSPEGSTNAFGVHIADVEVDPETGKVTVLRYTAIQDAGKAVHPSYVEGQMQGGAVQGIGWALNEEYFFDAKRPDAERQLPRLPDADLPGRADDRDDHRRGAEPDASLRRARRGRDADRPSAGHDRQRDPRGRRRADDTAAHVARRRSGRPSSTKS